MRAIVLYHCFYYIVFNIYVDVLTSDLDLKCDVNLPRITLLQLGRHGDVLPAGVGAGGQPEPHAAEADGGARLHHGSPDGLPSNSGQLRGCTVPESIRYKQNQPHKPVCASVVVFKMNGWNL